MQTRRILAAVAIVSVALGVLAYRMHHRYKHFAVHEPGRVYRSAWVADEVLQELIPRYHIRTVLNLCDIGEMGDRHLAERHVVESAGARLIEIPFPPNDTWTTDHPAVTQVEQIFDDPAAYPIWIHCQHGEERTAKALAIYDIRRRNLTAQASLSAMPLWSGGHPWHVITFAHNYETLSRQSAEAACAARPTPDASQQR
jgi:hypothetical protein